MSEVADRLREKCRALEGLCEAVRDAEADQDAVGEAAAGLMTAFRRTAVRFESALEGFDKMVEAADLQGSRLDELTGEIDEFVTDCIGDSRELMEHADRIETHASGSSDMWRVASGGLRQARMAHQILSDFNVARQLRRRIPFERVEAKQETDAAETMEETADEIRDMTQDVQDMINELLS